MRLKKDQLITASVVVAMCSAYAGLIHLPGVKRQKAMQQRVQAAEARLAATPPDIEAAQRELAQAQQRLADETKALPERIDSSSLLGDLADALDRPALREGQITQADAKGYANYGIQPVHMEFRGDFSDAFMALREIESLARPIRIERLELIGSPDESSGAIEAVVQISAFYGQEAGNE